MFLPSNSPAWPRADIVQAIVGIAVVIGAGTSWQWPALARPYLLLVGLVLVGAILWYSIFMVNVLVNAQEYGNTRFSHAPGVLALGLDFGVRLFVDFGFNETHRALVARRATIAAMVVGAVLDLLVVTQMVPRVLK